MSDEPVTTGDTPSSPVGAPPSHAPRFLLLNAIFPGLGHLAAGRWKWALLLGGPLLILLLALVLAGGDERPHRARGAAVRPGGADRAPRRRGCSSSAGGCSRSARPASITPITAARRDPRRARDLAAIVLGPQLVVAGLTVDARDAATEVFAPVAEGGAWVPTETAPPVAPNDPDFAVPTRPPPPTGRSSPARRLGHAGGPAGQRAADRHGLGRRPEHRAHRHDDRRLARPGREDGLDGRRSRATWSTCPCPTAASTAARSTAS